ncbi:MAG: type II toxin-antitoxin system RelE/ParE family toxin [Bacteroidetes bacterium]|nr:type II toxin-antitoxin system RelE/ParE family toxin [Bacteroidota bacterium]
MTVADRIPKFFQHLEGTVSRFQIPYFCCFDEGQVVVLFNGFQKKSQKTPTEEIEKAVKIMKEYFDEKLKLKQNESKKSKK